MQRYRVWQASRKEFLYPENWLEPELGDGERAASSRAAVALSPSAPHEVRHGYVGQASVA